MNTYLEALVAIKDEGKKAYRIGWNFHGKVYVFLQENNTIPNLTIYAKNGNLVKYSPSFNDINTNDWIIID